MPNFIYFFDKNIKWIIIPIGIFATAFWTGYNTAYGLCDSYDITYGKFKFIAIVWWGSGFSLAIISFLVYFLKVLYNKNKQFARELEETKVSLEEHRSKRSFCCVKQQDVPKCPLGIKQIHEEMQATLVSNILETKRSFRYLGLSGFATLHNNVECFNQRPDVKYKFFMSNPDNIPLAQANDKWFKGIRGRIDSKTLIDNGHDLIKKIKAGSENEITFNYVNQIPSFRVVIIDDQRAYVSFYEPRKDAMRTTQLEIEADETMSSNIFNWFKWYSEKVEINESVIKDYHLQLPD